MEQIGPMLEEFMGTLEELGQAVQQTGQQMKMLMDDGAKHNQEMARIGAKVDMLEKALNQPAPYEQQSDPAMEGGGMDPAMMEQLMAAQQGGMPPGMDPAMMEQLMAAQQGGMPPGMDPAMMDPGSQQPGPALV